MTKYSRLSPQEVLLEGKWVAAGENVIADDVCRRIEYLIQDILLRIANDESGWMTLYKDPADARYWELSYPDSDSHGGGAPVLRFLPEQEVRQRYVIS